MVVDDDKYVLDLLDEFLSGEGYDVATAESGETALEKQQSSPVDIALVDFRLPGIDGLETIRRMGRISAQTVTIIMTGFPTLDSSISALRLGASDYIIKPFKLEEVSSSVRKAEEKRRKRREITQLQHRVAELERSIDAKKDTIKVHKNLVIAPGIPGHSAKPADPDQEGRVNQGPGA
jgi:DNA-binding NtrC family response regulator